MKMSNKLMKISAIGLMAAGLVLTVPAALAKTVSVTFTAKEVSVEIDNKGTTYPAWTYDGMIPGKVVRVTEGDVVDFKLINPKENKNSHSIDFHAAEVDVLDEFAPVKPGHTKHFKFTAKRPGTYMYHCGAPTMAQHIARGMYGLIIVDPKGKITRYMNGIYFLPFELKMTLLEAAESKSGPTINRVLQFCYSYDPEGQQYVMNITKVAGTLIIFMGLMLFLVLVLVRKRKTSNV